MRQLCLVILLALILTTFISGGSAHGNISVYSYGSNYIVWEVGGNTIVWLDGKETDVYGLTYGQYDLQPGTEHIACNIDGNCTGIQTKDDFWSVFAYWGVYFILIVLVSISYFIPISALPAMAYSLYLFTTYLPESGAGFNEYFMVGILVALACLAAVVGMRKV